MKSVFWLAPILTLAAIAYAGDPLAGALWKKRLLLIATPSLSDERYREQTAVLAPAWSGLAERDVELVVAPPGDPRRARLPIKDGDFMIALIGLDGGIKLARRDLLTPEALFKEIDSMPMRRSELKSAERARQKGEMGAPMTAVEVRAKFTLETPFVAGGWQGEGPDRGESAIRPWLFDWPVQAGPFCKVKSGLACVFLAGDRAEILVLRADHTSEALAIGSDLATDERPIVALHAGDTFALRLKPGGAGGWALLGFTANDSTPLTVADPAELARRFPDRADWFKTAGAPAAKREQR